MTDDQTSIGIATDLFLERWGFGEPPPAYRALWEADLATLAWLALIPSASQHDPK